MYSLPHNRTNSSLSTVHVDVVVDFQFVLQHSCSSVQLHIHVQQARGRQKQPHSQSPPSERHSLSLNISQNSITCQVRYIYKQVEKKGEGEGEAKPFESALPTSLLACPSGSCPLSLFNVRIAILTCMYLREMALQYNSACITCIALVGVAATCTCSSIQHCLKLPLFWCLPFSLSDTPLGIS